MQKKEDFELDYQPPFTITEKIMLHVASISEKLGNLSNFSNLESKPHLRKNNTVKSVHASVRIEANSLSFEKALDILNGKQVLGDRKEIQEIKNAYAAYAEVSKLDIYNIEELKRMHGLMMHIFWVRREPFVRGRREFLQGKLAYLWLPQLVWLVNLCISFFLGCRLNRERFIL